MKRWSVFYVLGIMLSMFFMVACDEDDGKDVKDILEGETRTSFDVKQGTIHYNNNTVLIFDDYGKKLRLESYSENGNVPGGIVIEDGTTSYSLSPAQKVAISSGVMNLSASFLFYDGKYSGFQHFGLSKTEKTIAGKSCTTYTWTVEGVQYEYSGWKGIVIAAKGGDDIFTATSISEAAPAAGSFTVPSDYQIMSY